MRETIRLPNSKEPEEKNDDDDDNEDGDGRMNNRAYKKAKKIHEPNLLEKHIYTITPVQYFFRLHQFVFFSLSLQ